MTIQARQQSGFNIVELLIVVVIIAILAAITIVAYNGIQTRARNSQTTAAVSAYIKAIGMYAVDNSSYPTQTSACLGTGYEYQGMIGRCGGAASINENSAFNTALAPYISSKPQPSTKNLTISMGSVRAGAYYDFLSPNMARIYYILEGQSDACLSGDTRSATAGAPDMYCTHMFPAL